MKTKHVVLSIAGSDSGGGAGIQADIKTIESHGLFATTAITAITAQNTLGVQAFEPVSPLRVRQQIESVFSDFKVAAVKTGMIPNAEIVETVVECLKTRTDIPCVVDPVMISTSGDSLIDDRALTMMTSFLIPMADLVTPNIDEARALSGEKIEDRKGMMHAAEKIFELGCNHVLIKGGHLKEQSAVDVLFDGERFIEYSTERIEDADVHGTGCTFASAIASNLAVGQSMEDAVYEAKIFLTQSILERSTLGRGSQVLGWS